MTKMKTAHWLCIAGIGIVPMIGIICTSGCTIWSTQIKDVIVPLNLVVIAGYFLTDRVSQPLIRRISMVIKNKKEREKQVDNLINERHELLDRVSQIENKISVLTSDEAEAQRIAHKVVNEAGTEFATKKDVKELAGMIYELDKKLRIDPKKDHNTNQTTTTEENTPKSDKIVF